MKFETGKNYIVKLSKKHNHSIIKAKYIEYNEKEDYHVVQTVEVIEWKSSPMLLDVVKNGLQFVVDEKQILEEA